MKDDKESVKPMLKCLVLWFRWHLEILEDVLSSLEALDGHPIKLALDCTVKNILRGYPGHLT